MNTSSFFFVVVFLFSLPLYVFGFSENEMEALESSGTIQSSESPWRKEISVIFQRNIKTNIFDSSGNRTPNYEARKKQSLLDSDQEDSLLDFSNLYYTIGLSVNYTPLEIVKKFGYNWLKNTEFFLNSSFSTPVTGHISKSEKNRTFTDRTLKYIHYAIGNPSAGFQTLLHKKEEFVSYFNFSVFVFPLNRFSREAGFISGANGSVSLVYFLKKMSQRSWIFSSSHSVAYKRYNKEYSNEKKSRYNTPFRTSQTGNISFRQSSGKSWLPSSTGFSITHLLGINKNQTWNQYLSWRISSSWKIRKALYFILSIEWEDSIHSFNRDPKKSKVKKWDSIGWLDLDKYIVSIGGSLSF